MYIMLPIDVRDFLVKFGTPIPLPGGVELTFDHVGYSNVNSMPDDMAFRLCSK